jgi:hypothetical protein
MRKYILIAILLISTTFIFAQVNRKSDLFKIIKTKDSLLFDIGFNHCDISQFQNLISEKFEFYHDKSGITPTKQAFIKSVQDGLCKLSYKPRRELVNSSMEVYPMMRNDTLYGAIQIGVHRFYALEKDKPEYLTSIAKFTHVWILENGEWKLTKGLSYDHQAGTGEKKKMKKK